MIRKISYSEVFKALDCQAAWDFSYGDRLAGSALKPKRIAPMLEGGKAWGAAVAALHLGENAVTALDNSLHADAERQRSFGVYDESVHGELRTKLIRLLAHYEKTADPLVIMQPERELLVPIPSRTGGRSSVYRLQAFLDGVTPMEWIVEYKLRGQLSTVEQIERSRQIRWYAWAVREATGIEARGILVDERLNEVPKQPRVNKGRKAADGSYPHQTLSHAKDQMCTVEAYLAACSEWGEEPVQSTVEYLGMRRWQQRVPIPFTSEELDEAGEELVSGAKLIGLLDRGELYPIRNAKRSNCNGCWFNEICAAPDEQLVDALYERKPPKRDRVPEKEAIAA